MTSHAQDHEFFLVRRSVKSIGTLTERCLRDLHKKLEENRKSLLKAQEREEKKKKEA